MTKKKSFLFTIIALVVGVGIGTAVSFGLSAGKTTTGTVAATSDRDVISGNIAYPDDQYDYVIAWYNMDAKMSTTDTVFDTLQKAVDYAYEQINNRNAGQPLVNYDYPLVGIFRVQTGARLHDGGECIWTNRSDFGTYCYEIKKDGTWHITDSTGDNVNAEIVFVDEVQFTYVGTTNGAVYLENEDGEQLEIDIIVQNGIPSVTEK